MAPRYLKSQIDALPFDFAAAVTRYAADLQAFRANPVGDPPAAPHPLVAASIRIDDHTYVVDYEVVADPLPPPPTFDERKGKLMAQIDQALAVAESAVMSPARRHLLALDAADVANSTARADKATLAAYKAMLEKTKANIRHAVCLKIEVEDLSDEAALDQWIMTSFPHGASES